MKKNKEKVKIDNCCDDSTECGFVAMLIMLIIAISALGFAMGITYSNYKLEQVIKDVITIEFIENHHNPIEQN